MTVILVLGGIVAIPAAMVGGAVLMYATTPLLVGLDGTARWVELRNVHAEFARAADQQVRARHRAARQHDAGAL